MRGYLWSSLAEEIIDEFAALSTALPIEEHARLLRVNSALSFSRLEGVEQLPQKYQKSILQAEKYERKLRNGRSRRAVRRAKLERRIALGSTELRRRRPPPRIPPALTKAQLYLKRKKEREARNA